MVHPFIGLLIRLGLGTMWLTAGIAKLAAKEPRGEAVAQFGLMPRGAAAAVGAALPYAELTLGALLLAGLGTRAAAGASVVLLAVFGLAIAMSLVRGRRVECDCFGEVGRRVASWWSVLRNVALLAAALLFFRAPVHYLSLDGALGGGAVWPGDPAPSDFVPVLLMALAAVAFGALAVSASSLAQAAASASAGSSERRHLSRRAGPGHRPGGASAAATVGPIGR